MAWVPGRRSIFGNWTSVPSLYSWNVAECDVKPQSTTKKKTQINYRNTIRVGALKCGTLIDSRELPTATFVLTLNSSAYLFSLLTYVHIADISEIVHGEEHVKKLFSTAVIVNEDTHSNLVRGHCFTGEDTNIFHPWSLKLEGFFRKSTNISFYMVTNLFIYTTGSSHIIDDCSRAVCFCQSFIGL